MILVSDIYNTERRPTRRLIALMKVLMRKTYNSRGTDLVIDRFHFYDMVKDLIDDTLYIGTYKCPEDIEMATYLGLQVHHDMGLGANHICILEDDFGNSVIGRY